jgi:hypothetical protein
VPYPCAFLLAQGWDTQGNRMKILYAREMSFERARLESRINLPKKATEKRFQSAKKHPSAAKAGVRMACSAARLKPCPFKASVPEARAIALVGYQT